MKFTSYPNILCQPAPYLNVASLIQKSDEPNKIA